MTASYDCDAGELTITSTILNDPAAVTSDLIITDADGTEQTIDMLGNTSPHVESVTLTSGVYRVVLKNVENDDDVTIDEACIFADCDPCSIFEEAAENDDAWQSALDYWLLSNMPACDCCDNAMIIWKRLRDAIDECRDC